MCDTVRAQALAKSTKQMNYKQIIAINGCLQGLITMHRQCAVVDPLQVPRGHRRAACIHAGVSAPGCAAAVHVLLWLLQGPQHPHIHSGAACRCALQLMLFSQNDIIDVSLDAAAITGTLTAYACTKDGFCGTQCGTTSAFKLGTCAMGWSGKLGMSTYRSLLECSRFGSDCIIGLGTCGGGVEPHALQHRLQPSTRRAA